MGQGSRSYGYRYSEASNLRAAEIAKLMRADIKQATSEGLLPADLRYSVTSDSFSGGRSIDITVKGFAGDVYVPDEGSGWCRGMTAEAEAIKMTLERIHSAYNHDGSDSQTDYFDVNYYGTVTFEDSSSAAWRVEQKAKAKARKQATDRGVIVGKVTHYGRENRVVHLLVETTAGEKRYACGAVSARFSLLAAAAADAVVTCSRCATREASGR